MGQTTPTLPTSEHFQLDQIAPGVYAAIAVAGSATHSNAGIIDLGDHTLIFDALATPLAAEDLRGAAKSLTGRPASYAVNSHFHSDHWDGNQVFGPHTAIISTHKIRELMLETAEDIKEWRQDSEDVQAWIRGSEERLAAESDERVRAYLEASLKTSRHIAAALPTLIFRLPDLTFEHKLVLHGTERTVELHAFENGHTPSDVVLVLPEERIVFMGDLAFFQEHPFMAHADPQGWTALLEKMERSELETFVPGHGPLGTKADIALEKQYIAALQDLVEQVVQVGGSADEAAQQAIPAPFDAWLKGLTRFEINVRSLHQRLSGASES
jgi:glyoxylase-like metal-dependent hydrolase (beta-lactamase superfamily II)